MGALGRVVSRAIGGCRSSGGNSCLGSGGGLLPWMDGRVRAVLAGSQRCMLVGAWLVAAGPEICSGRDDTTQHDTTEMPEDHSVPPLSWF